MTCELGFLEGFVMEEVETENPNVYRFQWGELPKATTLETGKLEASSYRRLALVYFLGPLIPLWSQIIDYHNNVKVKMIS